MNASNVIDCVKIETLENPLLERIEPTYLASFPVSERRDFELLKQLMINESRFLVTALLKDGVYVGFITSWQFNEFCYIEHFAVDESARNGGIGGKALQQFLMSLDVPVVLEVELPVEELSRRRVGFYERLGFKLDTNPYRQPPYSLGGEWLDLRLMTYGAIDLKACYENVKYSLYKHVYQAI